MGWFHQLTTFCRTLQERRTFGVAAEMSFWLFLSLLPLSAVAALLTSRLALEDPSFLFWLGLPRSARSFVQQELNNVSAWNGGSVGPAAIVVFLWLASSGIHAIFDGFDSQLNISRSWWHKRVASVYVCLLLSLGAVLVATLTSSFEMVQAALKSSELAYLWSSILGRTLRTMVGVLVVYSMIIGLFRVGVPRRILRSLPLVPGAVVVVVLHGLLSSFYRIYLKKIGDNGAYLAGLTTIVIVMTALYFFSLSLLIGLAVNQHYAHLPSVHPSR